MPNSLTANNEPVQFVNKKQIHTSAHLANVAENFTRAHQHNHEKFFKTPKKHTTEAEPSSGNNTESPSIDYDLLAQSRFKLQFALTPRLAELDSLIPACFLFKTKAEKDALANELKHTYYLITLQYSLDKAVNNNANLKALLKCERYISYLTDSIKYQPASQSGENTTAWYRFISLFGIVTVLPAIHQDINTQLDEDGYVDGSISLLSQYNGGRLYWVWGGGFIATVLDCINEKFPQFFNTKGALDTVTAPSTATGWISFMLYYVRLAMNISQVAVHTVDNPLMSEEEAKIYWKRRMNMQWKPRKYSIFNDIFWANINLACFAVLTGSYWLTYANGALTVVLLMLDVSLTMCKLYGASKDAQKKLAFYEQELASLDENHPDKAKLEKIIKETKNEWKFKKISLINDLSYGILLVAAFALCVSFVIPPAAIPALAVSIMAIAGALSCFALGLAYEAVNSYLKLSKMFATTTALEKQFAAKFADFGKADMNGDAKKHLFLELQHLKNQIDHQKRKAYVELAKHIHNTAMRTAIPFFLFAALVFAPTGVGLGVIAAAALLAFVSYRALCLLEPKDVKLPEFDAAHYAACKDKPALIKHPEKKSMFSFFSRNSNAHGYQALNTMAAPA